VNIDKEKLTHLIIKYRVNTYIFGLKTFLVPVVNARKLFEELHTVADCSKEDFIAYVDKMNSNKLRYDEPVLPEIKILFDKLEFETVFRELGKENLNGDPCIRYDKIKDIFDLKNELKV